MISEYKEIINKNYPDCTKILMEDIKGFHGIAVVNNTIKKGLSDSFDVSNDTFFSSDSIILRTRIRLFDIFRLFKVDIYVFHDSIAYRYINPIKARLVKLIQGVYVKRAKHVVCISQHAKNELLKYHPDVNDIHVIYNSIIENKSSSSDYHLWVGSMKRHKRFDLIKEIARLRPDLNFVCVLPSSDINVDENNIVVLSSVPPFLMTKLFRDAQTVICTSEDEGFYLPFQEALAEGTPCAGLNIPVFTELYGKDDTVSLYKTVNELANGLCQNRGA